LRSAVELLGVEVDTLNDALCRCAIQVQGETLYKHLSVERAEKAAEALIKTTYAALFDHIVRRINSFITVRQKSNQGSNAVTTASIGVLDIFGFESFERNSFEQLCINFCNEALQQQFNRFVFKLEQQEYKKEGIEWAFIAFPDNQDVLDLIEKKHDGILSVLDEQCRLPRCNDKSFASAIYAKCGEHPRFEATKAQQGDLAFGVHHYAGMVEYDTDGFLEKNKDELPKETTELLLSSSYPFLALLGRELSEGSSLQQPSVSRKTPGGRKQLPRAASSLMRDSVGSQFCSQLQELRKRIESTSPHYVRCLKPNDELVPNNFDHIVIADQLRCAGVLEAIRVSRVGFPHRYFHDLFVQRYSLLGGSKLVRSRRKENAQELCEALVGALVPQLSRVMEQSDDNEEVVVQNRQGKRYVSPVSH
jgi:myosin-5